MIRFTVSLLFFLFSMLALLHHAFFGGFFIFLISALLLPFSWWPQAFFGSLRLGRQKGTPFSVRVLAEDRYLHTHLLGPTGMGKSTYLLELIAQDLHKGHGLTLFDPKGDLVSEVGELCTALNRPYQVFWPGQDGIAINPLAGDGTKAAESFLYALKQSDAVGHPFYDRLEQLFLRTAILAVKELNPQATLWDVLTFITDGEVRLQILRKVDDPLVRLFYRDLVYTWPQHKRQEYENSVALRLAHFLANVPLREAILGGDFTFEEHLGRGGVLLLSIPLEEMGLLGAQLGRMFMLRFQYAALSRATHRLPHFLYADEFQHFASDGFADFLAVARSYQVGAVLSHQHLSQLTPLLQDAILANARQHLALGGLSPTDLAWYDSLIGERSSLQFSFSGLRMQARLGSNAHLDKERLRRLPRGEALYVPTRHGRTKQPIWLKI